MDGAKAVSTSMSTKPPTAASDSVNPSEFHSSISALQYLTLTHPDIAVTMNHLAHSLSSPTDFDWVVVKRLFRYLMGTLDHGLFLRRPADLFLSAFADYDFGGDPLDRKPTSMYVVFFGPNPVSWRSQK